MNTEQIDTTIAQIDATDVSEECEGKVLLIEGVQATRIEQVRNAALESKAVGVIILDDDPDEVNTLQAAPQEVVGIPVYAVSRSSFGNRDLSGTQVKFKGKPICFLTERRLTSLTERRSRSQARPATLAHRNGSTCQVFHVPLRRANRRHRVGLHSRCKPDRGKTGRAKHGGASASDTPLQPHLGNAGRSLRAHTARDVQKPQPLGHATLLDARRRSDSLGTAEIGRSDPAAGARKTEQVPSHLARHEKGTRYERVDWRWMTLTLISRVPSAIHEDPDMPISISPEDFELDRGASYKKVENAIVEEFDDASQSQEDYKGKVVLIKEPAQARLARKKRAIGVILAADGDEAADDSDDDKEPLDIPFIRVSQKLQDQVKPGMYVSLQELPTFLFYDETLERWTLGEPGEEERRPRVLEDSVALARAQHPLSAANLDAKPDKKLAGLHIERTDEVTLVGRYAVTAHVFGSLCVTAITFTQQTMLTIDLNLQWPPQLVAFIEWLTSIVLPNVPVLLIGTLTTSPSDLLHHA